MTFLTFLIIVFFLCLLYIIYKRPGDKTVYATDHTDDIVMIYGEAECRNPMVITALFFLEKELDIDVLRMRFNDGLCTRFKQRLVKKSVSWWRPQQWIWEDDPNFSIEKHVVHIELEKNVSENRKEYDEPWTDEYWEFLEEKHSSYMPKNEAPWMLYHVTGPDPNSTPSMVFRFHHAIGDGFATIHMFNQSILDKVTVEPSSSTDVLPPVAAKASSAFKAPTSLFGKFMLGLEIGKEVVKMAMIQSDLPSVFKPPKASGCKKLAVSKKFATSSFRGIRDKTGATLNEVMMSCYTGALAKYMKLVNDEKIDPSYIQGLQVVSLRHPSSLKPDEMNNSIAWLFLRLPLSENGVEFDNAEDRLVATMKEMGHIKNLASLKAAALISRIIGATLPQVIAQPILGSLNAKISTLATNLNGKDIEQSILGVKIVGSTFFGPQSGEVCNGVAFVGSSGYIHAAFVVDVASVQDPKILAKFFEDEVDSLILN